MGSKSRVDATVPVAESKAEAFEAETEGLVDWMREADVKIGFFDLTCGGEPVVVLIGRGERAADLTAAYEALNVAVVYAESFEPPVALPSVPAPQATPRKDSSDE